MTALYEILTRKEYIYHSGGGCGFTSDMVMYPELKLGIVMLCNSSANVFTGPVLRYYTDSCIVARNGQTPFDPAGTEKMTKLNISDSRIKAVLGHYGDSGEGVIIERNKSNDCFQISLGQNRSYGLEFYDDHGELVGMFGFFRRFVFFPVF